MSWTGTPLTGAGHEENVRRLRQRIFKATQAGDLEQGPQSAEADVAQPGNTLVSVRRVTQRNAGRTTAGVDGEVALTSRGQGGAGGAGAPHGRPGRRPAGQAGVHTEGRGGNTPARNSGDLRPRAISSGSRTRWSPSGRPGSSPDRMGSGRAVAAMTRSRPSTRRCNGTQAKRQWILDADLTAAFDRIDHAHLLRQLGAFPGQGHDPASG